MSYRTIYHYNLPNGLTGWVDRFADGSYCFVPVNKFDAGLTGALMHPDMIDNGSGRGRYQFGPKFNTPRECMEYIESKGATLRKTEGRRS